MQNSLAPGTSVMTTTGLFAHRGRRSTTTM